MKSNLALAMLACTFVLASACRTKKESAPPVPSAVPSAGASTDGEGSSSPSADVGEGEDSQTFRLPSGGLPTLSCADSIRITKQVLGRLPFTKTPPDAKAFEKDFLLWLDPHGFWIDAADSPLPKAIQKRAQSLLGDLESGREGCPKAGDMAALFAPFARELKAAYDEGVKTSEAAADLQAAAAKELPDDAKALERATALGKLAGSILKASPSLTKHAERMQSRILPSLSDEEWRGVVLAAGVRAWVPQVDAHSSWAPLDEESTLYDVDLDDIAKGRLWKHVKLTAVGVVAEEPTAPLLASDVVLSVDDVMTAGLSLEQLDQLSVAPFEQKESADVKVLRQGVVTTLKVRRHSDAPGGGPPLPMVERVRFGDGDVAILRVEDVHDNLGSEIGREVSQLKRSERPVRAILLDLRGNGGGSVDGAIDALSHFLPKAPMCPMRSHGGMTPPDVTGEPPSDEAWTGPVLSLVDYDTASAAEILAGSLAAYKRGLVVGTPTYGKGCVQEYVDDEAHTGVLRVTSYLYALPDGKPVQRTGLKPDVFYPFMTAAKDLETKTPHVAPAWSGPDVRERPLPDPVELPKAGGPIGPCKDAAVCAALELLDKRPARIAKRK